MVASLDAPPPDGHKASEPGQTLRDARDFEQDRAEHITAAGRTGEAANGAYAAAPEPVPPSTPHELEIDGELGDYYDMRQLAYCPKCHPDT